MKKSAIVLFVLAFSSCAGVLSKKDAFIGDWALSESSPNYSVLGKITMKISKDDIFYKVDFHSVQKGEDLFNEDWSKDSLGKSIIRDYHKYQLSPDKRFLINIVSAESILAYNEDNNTITTPYGWFKKQ